MCIRDRIPDGWLKTDTEWMPAESNLLVFLLILPVPVSYTHLKVELVKKAAKLQIEGSAEIFEIIPEEL